MKDWKLELTSGGKTFAEVKIQRGMFQSELLSPQIFVLAIMPPMYLKK